MDNKLTLFINTIKYLKPSQGFYRVINRVKRKLYKKKVLRINLPGEIKLIEKVGFLISSLDFDSEYLRRFNLDEILKNKFEFINIKHKVSLKDAWNDKALQHLWRYNLHYFEYLYRIGFEYIKDNKNNKYYDKYKEFILNWIINNPYPYGDGWHPYTISLRITNWISMYEIFKDKIENDNRFKQQLIESIYLQYTYLQKNLEKDVLGNHYFENIKAVILGSIFFEESDVKAKFIKELIEQLEEQILVDGMHFELTPMYHKIILEGLIKITVWLKNEPIHNRLYEYIQQMINVMYSFEEGFGKTPAFNDSTDGISKEYNHLLETCRQEFKLAPISIKTLDKSGYYILYKNNYKLIFDCGEICPSYLPAHGHCDALSYELAIDGIPVLINSGTYRYEGGEWRDYFRKTKSHNTVMIGDKEQSQIWGSFRVANRISEVKRNRFNYEGIDFINGSYKSYHGSRHTRFIGSINEDVILVIDKVQLTAKEKVKSYIHIVPDTEIKLDKSVELKKENKSLEIIPFLVKDMSLESGWYSKAFNKKEENNHLEIIKSEDSNFFGYLICLNEIKCCIEQIDEKLKITIDREFIIDLNKLGEPK